MSMKKTLTLLLALVLCLTLSATALAAFEGYTPVAGDDEVPVNKHLVLDKDAPVPTVTFNFVLRAATDDELDDNITAGPMTPAAPTASSVTLSSTSGVYTSAADATGKTELASIDWTTKKVVHGTFELDFTGVNFTAPGIYRYVLAEVEGDLAAVTYDSSTKYVDVYVVNGTTEGTLVVDSYIIHDAEESDFTFNTDTTAGMTVTGKSEGFENELTTYDLTLQKVLTGNQANFTDTFEFTIVVTLPTGLTSTETYTIETVTETVAVTTDLTFNGASATAVVTLGHNAKIRISDLPKGTTVTITEADSTDLYSVSYVVDGNDSVKSSTTGEQTVNADMAVVFTNTLNGTIPTGVLLTIAPFAVLMVVGLIGVVVFLKKRKN